MKINRVTITGADDKVDHIKLLELTEKSPYVEWGILFSQSKEGEQRYPKKDWIDFAIEIGLPMSAHLCGHYAREVMEKQEFHHIINLSELFKRVQINYNFERSTGWDFVKFMHFVKRCPERQFILQYNESNATHIAKFLVNDLPGNFNFLYDASGGSGKPIKQIGETIGGYYTGYSGGLSDLNVVNICHIIDNTKPDGRRVWLDMESGVRRNNEFALDKVMRVLAKTEPYAANHVFPINFLASGLKHEQILPVPNKGFRWKITKRTDEGEFYYCDEVPASEKVSEASVLFDTAITAGHLKDVLQ